MDRATKVGIAGWTAGFAALLAFAVAMVFAIGVTEPGISPDMRADRLFLTVAFSLIMVACIALAMWLARMAYSLRHDEDYRIGWVDPDPRLYPHPWET